MNELTGAIPAHLMDRPEPANTAPGAMGKDDFMVLLMAQLRHQDPLNPMDHKEFSAQLAQFASLEKLTQIGTGIEKLEGGMGEESKRQALGMIGKRVQARGAEVDLVGKQPVDIRLNTEDGFKPLKVSIYSGDGKLVREMDVDPKKHVEYVNWDGTDQMGENAPDGKYHFRVAGIGTDGVSREMAAELSGKVIGVEMTGTNPLLVVQTPSGQSRVELAKVVNIAADEPPAQNVAAPNTAGPAAVSALGQPIEQPAPSEPAEDPTLAWPDIAGSGRGWAGGGR